MYLFEDAELLKTNEILFFYFELYLQLFFPCQIKFPLSLSTLNVFRIDVIFLLAELASLLYLYSNCVP